MGSLLSIKILRVKIVEFLEDSRVRNSWIEGKGASLYLRKGYHLLPGGELEWGVPNCLDVASVEIAAEMRGFGYFSELMGMCEKINPYQFIFVESVLSNRVRGYCEAHGYSKIHDDTCYYKLNGSK